MNRMNRRTRNKCARAAAAILAAQTAAAAAYLPAQAASVTDLQQQAEDLVNQNVISSGTAVTEENNTDSEDGTQEAQAGVNTADISGTAADSYETITVRTTEEFRELAKNCRYDTWSRDKKVLLEADLDFSKEEFTPIESFGGIFDGQGHTISGISISGSMSETGVFGTIQNTGTVSNLKAEGIIAPSGSQSKLGGIAGINYGQITDCSFDGRLEGNSELGGIVGRNGRMGTISSCTSGGAIVGTTSCGGIAGYNEGTILNCVNEANVNTTYQDSNRTVDQLSSTIENILTSGDLTSFENLEINADTGGIAGFSSGVIASCTNEAQIGYAHVGYNVGGIAGRSSGFLQSNTNNGTIYGRKDVGGIVGQMQPYLSVEFTEDALSSLESELDQLDSLVNTGLDNADSYSTSTLNHLTNITGLTRTAQDSAKGLAREGADQYDQAVSKLNTATSTLQSSLSTLAGTSGKLGTYLNKAESAVSSLGTAAGSYLQGISLSQEDRTAVTNYISQFKEGAEKVRSGVQQLADLNLDGPSVEDADSQTQQELRQQVSEALTTIREGYEEMNGAVDGMVEILSKEEYQGSEEAQEALSSLQDVRSSLDALNEEIQNAESRLHVLDSQDSQDAFTNGDFSVSDLNGLVKDLTQQQAELLKDYPDIANPELDPDTHSDEELTAWFMDSYGLSQEDAAEYTDRYKTCREQYKSVTESIAELLESAGSLGTDPEAISNWIKESAEDIRKTLEQIQSGISDQKTSISGLLKIAEKYSGNALNTSDLATALKNAGSALQNAPDVTSDLSGALNALASLDLKLNGISDAMRSSGTNLYDAMNQLNSEIQSLNDALRTESGEGLDNLRAITSQFDTVMETLREAAEDVKNVADNSVEDVSDEDVAGTYEGRVTSCTNYGAVNGDTNAGGITGMIGVEYDLDPETDIQSSGTSSLDYIFHAKCIADHCTNRGKVTARSNYCGGIAGHMEMGLAADNANYETVKGNNYVGGIAGYSVGAVRDNTAKCEVSGAKYVGGIAGYGVTLRNNLAMVNAAESTQYVGAIAGRVKNIDAQQVSGNYYYSSDMYGIDGVSYAGIAEGKAYDELTEMEGIPDSFHQLVLTFRADDALVKTIACTYGTSIPDDQIPEVPEKEGFHSRWSRTDFSEITSDEVIEAEYSRINTLLVSGEKRSVGQPTIEVAGSFRQEDSLVVTLMRTEGTEEERWMVSIPEDGETVHQIRYLASDTNPDPVIYLIQDGKKTKVQTGTLGKYVTFDAEGSSVTFAVERGSFLDSLPVLGGTLAAAAGAVAVILHGILKKKRRERESRLRSGGRRRGGHRTGKGSKGSRPAGRYFDASEWLDDEV